MTIKDLIKFLQDSAKNCKQDGVDTPLKSITFNSICGETFTTDPEKCNFILKKYRNNVTGNEYVNLIIEEDF